MNHNNNTIFVYFFAKHSLACTETTQRKYGRDDEAIYHVGISPTLFEHI